MPRNDVAPADRTLSKKASADAASATAADARLAELGYKSELSRSMSLTDVVIYGLIFMVPMAPVSVFGVIFNLSHGMVALVYLVAAFAMFFSALSYKEMAKTFPVAGSVYSYVRLGTNRFLGFLSGWAILLDYLLLPALLCIFGASAMAVILPTVPQWIWVVIFVALAAFINLRGIRLTARMNIIFLIIQCIALALFIGGALVAIFAGRAHLSLDPIYQPNSFSWPMIFAAIPVAALSYIGFDAISTLNEEAKGGGKAVSKATMVVLFLVAAMFLAQTYFAALFQPVATPFTDGDATNNAMYYIAGVVIGPWFRVTFTLVAALIAIFANTLVSHVTSSKLVFAMARDGQLPRVLGTVTEKHKVPRNAMIAVAIVTLLIGLAGVGQIEVMTTLVTFGALTAYILLHVSVIVHFGVRTRSRGWFIHWVSPFIGIAVLGYALWSTNIHAKILGIVWIILGCGIASVLKWKGRSLDTSDV